MGYYDHKRWRAGDVFEMRVEDMAPVNKGQEEDFNKKDFELKEPVPGDDKKGFVARALPRWVERADGKGVGSHAPDQSRNPVSMSGYRLPVSRPGKLAEVNTGNTRQGSSGDAEVI
jgi:hypothetical protein